MRESEEINQEQQSHAQAEIMVRAWLDSLKIALMNNDENKAFALTQNLPNLLNEASLESKLQAKELISQTIELLQLHKNHTRLSMEQIRAAKNFFS